MDIEGSEYRCLNDLINFQDKLSGAIIEFHDVDLNINLILAFIKNFNLTIAHVHANNCAPIKKNGIPLVIEITFSKYGNFENSTPALPHLFDACNDPSEEEIKINFN